MALFGFRRKNDTIGVEADKKNIPAVEYADFEQAMIKAVNIGAKDTKIVTVRFEGKDSIELTVSGEYIKYATDFNDTKVLSRLQWVSDEVMSPTEKENVREIVNTSPFFTAMQKIKNELSAETAAVVFNAYNNNTINIMEAADRKSITRTESDWTLKDDSRIINAYDEFSLHITEISKLAENRKELFKKAIQFLDGNDFSDISVHTTELTDYSKAVTDEERLVLAAAEANSSLTEIEENSVGFDWIKVLNTIESLMWKSFIKVNMPADDEDIPEMELSTDDFNKFLAGEEDDGWRFEIPPTDPNDDGGFGYENDGYTEGLNINLREAIQYMMDEANVAADMAEEIIGQVKYNEDLENSVRDLERLIYQARTEYDNHFGDYQDLAVQKITEEVTEVEETVDNGEIENGRNASNQQFFSLEKLESERAVINEMRYKVLTQLLNLVSGIAGVDSGEAIRLIKAKLHGIETVVNTALYDNKDDEFERHNVDDALLKNYDYDETPMFFNIVEKFGYNPFE